MKILKAFLINIPKFGENYTQVIEKIPMCDNKNVQMNYWGLLSEVGQSFAGILLFDNFFKILFFGVHNFFYAFPKI